ARRSGCKCTCASTTHARASARATDAGSPDGLVSEPTVDRPIGMSDEVEKNTRSITMTTSTRVIAAALVAIVTAFIGSTILVQRSAKVIDEYSLRISRDAAPGIQVVSDLRAELRELYARVFRTVEGRGSAEAGGDEGGGWGGGTAGGGGRGDGGGERGAAPPADPPEAVLLGKLHSAIRAFDEASERALEQARVGHLAQARETIRLEVRP